MLDDRARVTVGQIVMLVYALAILAAFAPVFFASLDANADVIGTGPGLLFRALVPLMVVALLHWLWLGATGGSA